MNRRLLSVLFAGAALAIPFAATSAQTSGPVVRDSVGTNRLELAKMEMQEFPSDAWSKLSAWTGEAITGGDNGGKPILIFAWASWHPSSLKAINNAKQMADKFGPQGLVVVGAHHPTGWDKAAEIAKARGLDILQAHDANGEFRKALKMSSEPSWFVIDRAGRLRYASVATTSVENAVAEVVGETREHASDLPRVLSERAAKEAALQGRTADIRQNFDLTSLPAVPPGYIAPGEEAYEKVKWPKMDVAIAKELQMYDEQEKKQKTPEFTFEPEGFHPREPITDGRFRIVYLWHPDIYQSYSGLMPEMDVLQRQYPRDIAIIGALTPAEVLDTSRNQGGQGGLTEEAMEKLQKKFREFVASRTFEHPLAADLSGSALNAIGGQQGNNKFPIPGAMIVSSDGIIRWVGFTNDSDFKYAIDVMLANDPAVLARRAADRKYIEERSKR